LEQSKKLKGRFIGEKSRTYGMKWMCKDNIVVFVRPDEFNNFLKNGYHFGKK